MIVILSCGRAKLVGRHKSVDMYTGNYFLQTLRYARSIKSDNDIYIVSAKYGLLKLHQTIDSYNLKMGQPGSISADKVKQQADLYGVSNDSVMVIGGVKYVNLMRSVFDNVCAPFNEAGRMGPQCRLLKQNLGVNICEQQ